MVALNKITGSVRYIWNYFLDLEQKEYASTQKFRFFYQNCLDLTTLKQTTEWLNDTPAVSLQQTLRNLDRALKQSFKKNKVNGAKGFPKFKKKRNFDASFSLTMVNSNRNVLPNKFYLPKVGDVKCVYHRDLPSDFKSCQIKQEGDRWFVVLTVSKEQLISTKTGKTTGVDLNSKECVLADGTRHVIPKYLKENQFKIKQLQRSVSRKSKESKNRQKAQLKLYKVHQTVKNKRLDYFHKLSKQLVDEYDLISLEDLDVKSMQKKYGKMIGDNGFSLFRGMILYKAELYGKNTVIINRYFPSSQLCSGCGSVQKMPTEVRIYECKCCGLVIDRDLNAAINIDRAGTAQSAFGDDQEVNEAIIFGKLLGINEEGSYAL